MAETTKLGPKVMVGVMLDDDVREQLEAYALHIREKRNSIVQRIVIQLLSKEGFWPPAGAPVVPVAKKKS